MRIHTLQHVPFEGLGSIDEWAARRGAAITMTSFFADDSLPTLDAIDWLVVMGGPMNIYQEDTYPWLSQEKKYIKDAIAAGKIVLGICLGAQLIADALGAQVVANQHKEIGWFPITLSHEAGPELTKIFPAELTVMHWHGDTFHLPPGARRLASSAVCLNQGFIYKERVVGLQFHLESTPESLKALIENCSDELVAGPYIQDQELLMKEKHRFKEINEVMDRLLEHLSSLSS